METEEGFFQEWYSPEDMQRFGNRTPEITKKLGFESRIEDNSIYLPLKGRESLLSLAGELLALSPIGDMTLNEILVGYTFRSYLKKESVNTMEEAEKILKEEI